jgi:predicted homoserine dehydrogenase-like protein
VGLAGTGFIGSGLVRLLEFREDILISKVLTRRAQVPGIEPRLITSSMEQLVESCDVIFEASGDVNRAAELIQIAFAAGKPVVSLAAEFHSTIGSWFVGKGYLTEAEGDQPGSTAALREEAIEFGFEPIVYGNIKGFLNHTPSAEEMHYWSERQGISLSQVTSFTDGTKLQIEQAVVANGFGADILQSGLTGTADQALDVSANQIARKAKALGKPVSDYVLNRTLPAGVFVTSEHHSASPEVLRYFKLGEGPFYTLLRPFHLCHLEALKTLKRAAAGGPELLNNGATPKINVAAVAKRSLRPGRVIEQAIGGFDFRGEATRFSTAPDAVPLGLLQGATLKSSIEPGQVVTWGDVDLPDTLASRLGLELLGQRRALATSAP